MVNFKERLKILYPSEYVSIKTRAHQTHASVNQTYDRIYPYGLHLDMVADNVAEYANELQISDNDILPVWFGTYFHDSIEDARLTYNDVVNIAREYMPEHSAILAADIVYALTNEKGRTRAERANEKYYQGICTTPYAPFVKLADRFANFKYSIKNEQHSQHRMIETYKNEMSHFLEAINSPYAKTDMRYSLPPTMVREINSLLDSVL